MRRAYVAKGQCAMACRVRRYMFSLYDDYDARRERAVFEADWDALEWEQADHARREHERYGGEDARLPLLPRRGT